MPSTNIWQTQSHNQLNISSPTNQTVKMINLLILILLLIILLVLINRQRVTVKCEKSEKIILANDPLVMVDRRVAHPLIVNKEKTKKKKNNEYHDYIRFFIQLGCLTVQEEEMEEETHEQNIKKKEKEMEKEKQKLEKKILQEELIIKKKIKKENEEKEK